ncbi:MAG TPA: UDP-glucuronic acid decarboxylase family protein [Hyphomicrobiaceae bacterium]|nr:UDP-glucuronic acid decarboxylase family protein [Hyphomicrobiaceae bacterium]
MARDGRPRRILVAGAAGFIGSHLCDALVRRGKTVIGVDNFWTGSPRNIAHLKQDPRFTFLRLDIIDPLPLSLRADVIFNLACAASPPRYQADPVHTMLTNVLGTRNLLALTADCGARFVLASTSEVYGDPLVHPQTEDYWGNVNPTGPRACYDEGKRAAETLAFDYLRSGRADARVARIFNTYGPRMRADDGRVVANLITQSLRNSDLTIYGDGSQTRSFCYVDDLVDGLLRLATYERPVPRPVNLGNPTELTVLELARKVRELTGSSSRLVEKPLPVDDPKRRQPNIAAARTLLGWTPRVPLANGLAKTIDWFASESLAAEPGDRLGKRHAGRISRRAGWSEAGRA